MPTTIETRDNGVLPTHPFRSRSTATLLASPVAFKDVPIRGTQLTIYPVSARESMQAAVMYPDPPPPMVPDPKRGSLAPLIPDDNAPEYRAALAGARVRRMAATVAIATRWTLYDGTSSVHQPLDSATLDKAVNEILDVLSQDELLTLVESVRTFDLVEQLGTAAGN